jgi:cytochrome b561
MSSREKNNNDGVTMSKTERYTRVAIVLHWLIALGVLAQIAFGWWMIDIPKSPPGVRAYWFNIHKSIGLTLGMLILLRVVWRFTHSAPPLPDHVAGWQRVAATVSHYGLYACMIIMPVSGYLGSSFTKYPIVYFGYKLPHWGWDAPAYKEICSQVHYIAVVVFMTLIAIHLAAAIKHMIAKDGVIQRMWGSETN